MCWNTAVDDCLFCRIVAGELPSTRVYEDDRVIAIMDIFPATRGHVLVIPRAHATDMHEVSERRPGGGCRRRQAAGGPAVRGLGADGVTIMQSNGAAAWQTVFHYHVHVIPRYDGDPLVLPWRPGTAPADPAELADISRSYFSD